MIKRGTKFACSHTKQRRNALEGRGASEETGGGEDDFRREEEIKKKNWELWTEDESRDEELAESPSLVEVA